MNALSTAALSRTQPRPYASHRILVADDLPANQVIMQRALIRLGYACDLAENGKQALFAAQASRYELIIMDSQMPEMGGLEATRHIRAYETARNSHTPIILHSTDCSPENLEAFLLAGADGYLTKPIRGDELRHLLETYLAHRPAATQ